MIKRVINIAMANLIVIFLTIIILIRGPATIAQQINIPTIEKMPNIPSPFIMRDWKKTASGYDSLVFNTSLRGQYLPLIFAINNTVNYPGQNSFGINSYVGSLNPNQGEAINVLPAIIGASLIGIDKSNQNGRNYVLESREYFNKRPAEDIYLNEPYASSGSDWWYETTPNIFFYQLYSFYPATPEYKYQLTSVADRWLSTIYAMGGSTTPWKFPNMDYRAWNLSSMTPNSSGVHEPEASGAIAWIMYNAFNVTGEKKYRIASELAMEFLNSFGSNPSYEIQLPYGTYLAARMNAELGTNYDIEKLVNWCFDNSPLRNWGATTGKWGVFDVNGLIGELQPRNYAFAMNTFEQIGALVPLVRYDQRFARAIGKWVLNAENSSRLFYSNYTSDSDQDSRSWAKQYDPNSVIAYEALLKTDNNWIRATGDAISGGWANTNLSLYSSSHVGILGGIIDTTNVSMILKLDLLKTDYFHKDAYPSFLIFNPYNTIQNVKINIGPNSKDIYDAVSHSIISRNVQGESAFGIAADQAVIAVIIPAGSLLKYDLDKTLVDGIIIDYKNGMSVQNYPPRIKSLSSSKSNITVLDSTNIFCTADDREGQKLIYVWSASGGKIIGSGPSVIWKTLNSTGIFSLSVVVVDSQGGKDSSRIQITVSDFINYSPVINNLKASPRKINIGSSSILSCVASDQNGDSLSYSWIAPYGILAGVGKNISWKAPIAEGNYFIKCMVSDTHGATITDSIGVEVRDFSKINSGNLVAFYPFNGNANDQSGFHNGIVNGAILSNDRFGVSNQAYSFDGINENILIPNSSSLNFTSMITVSLWFKISSHFQFNREAFLISHGSWQNRWKISISNKKIRWTIKTDSNINAGTKDLDSETELTPDKLYFATVIYSGSDMELWLNGELDSFTKWSGKILPSSVDLTIAQMLPSDSNYNFNGVIDDIHLYDYALSVDEIKKLYDFPVDIKNNKELPVTFLLNQNYPNPFNPATIISYELPVGVHVTLKVYDILGRETATLVDKYQDAGIYYSQFSINNQTSRSHGYKLSSGIYFYKLVAGAFTSTKKMLLIK